MTFSHPGFLHIDEPSHNRSTQRASQVASQQRESYREPSNAEGTRFSPPRVQSRGSSFTEGDEAPARAPFRPRAPSPPFTLPPHAASAAAEPSGKGGGSRGYEAWSMRQWSTASSRMHSASLAYAPTPSGEVPPQRVSTGTAAAGSSATVAGAPGAVPFRRPRSVDQGVDVDAGFAVPLGFGAMRPRST